MIVRERSWFDEAVFGKVRVLHGFSLVSSSRWEGSHTIYRKIDDGV